MLQGLQKKKIGTWSVQGASLEYRRFYVRSWGSLNLPWMVLVSSAKVTTSQNNEGKKREPNCGFFTEEFTLFFCFFFGVKIVLAGKVVKPASSILNLKS
jgi:hypothetical protein